MSSHQKLIVPHFAAQFPIQMKRALGKDVILRRPRWGLSSTIARFPGAEAPGWPYVAPVGGFIHQSHLWVMSMAFWLALPLPWRALFTNRIYG